MEPFALPGGPIFGPRFAIIGWLSFAEPSGKNCFQTHTLTQIINIAIKHRPLKQNIEYARILQGGRSC